MNRIEEKTALGIVLKWLGPVLVLIVFVAITALLISSKKDPEEKEFEKLVPEVETVTVEQKPHQASILTEGTVMPRVSTMLISEVSGKVKWVSPVLYDGGFFEEGELLVKIEDSDYVMAVASAKSTLAQMEVLYAQEEALGEQARKDWESMGEGEPTELVLRIPQLKKAKADIEFAKAALKVAEENLAYTQVKAPYRGRVREKFVDLGQTVSPGVSQIASIYSTDSAEIALPLGSRDLANLDLPERFVGNEEPKERISVILSADYGGKTYEWEGWIDRTEGTVNPQTRMHIAIARVDQPYEDHEDGKPPLKIGMFVRAKVLGKNYDQAVVIPRKALQEGDLVHVLTEENLLDIREVHVVQRNINVVVISEGLDDGDQLILTPLVYVSEGMQLKPSAVAQSN